MHAPDPRTDEELMLAYAAGDLAAHRALFARFAPRVRRVALAALRADADADEVVQQTFLQVHRARHDFRAGRALSPWLHTIARNLIRDAFRRRGRAKETPLGTEGRLEPAASEPAPLPDAASLALVRRALDALPVDQRRAIELHFFEGKPFAEVAALVGATPSAVKVRAHRGYRRMRAWLETGERLARAGLR